jgi:hypothetical protein
MSAMNPEDLITVTADVRGGKPCIRGTRITVYDVSEYLAGGMTGRGNRDRSDCGRPASSGAGGVLN